MSKGDVIFVRGKSRGGSSSEQENIWNDSKLKEAYDKAVKIAQVEVAHRLANATNTSDHQIQAVSQSDKEGPGKQIKNEKAEISKGKPRWNACMNCRTVYAADGLEYEATITQIIDDKDCVVHFLGYDNYEVVKISSLKASRGEKARTKQIKIAVAERENGQRKINLSDYDSTGYTEHSSASQGKKQKKKCHKNMSYNDVYAVPNINDHHAMKMPIPPPIPFPQMPSEQESEEGSLSSMLLSWYMSGYYTGLYQGMKRAKGRTEEIKNPYFH